MCVTADRSGLGIRGGGSALHRRGRRNWRDDASGWQPSPLPPACPFFVPAGAEAVAERSKLLNKIRLEWRNSWLFSFLFSFSQYGVLVVSQKLQKNILHPSIKEYNSRFSRSHFKL